MSLLIFPSSLVTVPTCNKARIFHAPSDEPALHASCQNATTAGTRTPCSNQLRAQHRTFKRFDEVCAIFNWNLLSSSPLPYILITTSAKTPLPKMSGRLRGHPRASPWRLTNLGFFWLTYNFCATLNQNAHFSHYL